MPDEKPLEANVLTLKERISRQPGQDIFRTVAITIGLIVVWRTVLLRELQSRHLIYDLVLLAAVALAVLIFRYCREGRVSEAQRLFDTHEDDSKNRIRTLQNDLEKAASSGDPTMDRVEQRVKIQSEIEQLIIKMRESEHSKWSAYGPIFIPLVSAVLGFIGGLFFKANPK